MASLFLSTVQHMVLGISLKVKTVIIKTNLLANGTLLFIWLVSFQAKKTSVLPKFITQHLTKSCRGIAPVERTARSLQCVTGVLITLGVREPSDVTRLSFTLQLFIAEDDNCGQVWTPPVNVDELRKVPFSKYSLLKWPSAILHRVVEVKPI